MFKRLPIPEYPNNMSLTQPESQREDWYVITNYIAEFWCCISNIGFFIVCWYYNWEFKTLPILMAGICSFASHAVPLQTLLYADKLAVIIAVMWYIHLWQKIWYYLPILLAFNLFDTYCARNYGWTWTHIMWHLVAQYIAFLTISVY